MNYIGSKLKLSNFILQSVKQVVGSDLSQQIFCDLFAGTGIVSRVFKPEVNQIIANDLEYYSYVLNKNYIENNTAFEYSNLLENLNNLKPKKGFIFKNYCLAGGDNRQYFSDENGMKIDAIRQEIERLKQAEFKIYNQQNKVYNQDSNKLIKKIEGNVLYLDPPYNTRQYGANYHILNTISNYKEFIPKGITGLPDYNKSDYCKKGMVLNSFENLLKQAQFKFIFLSYNNEGLMPEKNIKKLMKNYGHYQLDKQSYQRFKADKTENRNHKANQTTEYLHILEKR